MEVCVFGITCYSWQVLKHPFSTEYQHSTTPEAPRRPTHDPSYAAHQHPYHPSSASTPRSVLPSTGGYPTPAPASYQHSGHPPHPTATRQPQSSGGQFSILRTTHNTQPMSTASSSTSYGGLSGNVRPLRPNEFSQYAVEQQGNGRMEVRYICPQCQKGFDRPSSLKVCVACYLLMSRCSCTSPDPSQQSFRRKT